MPTPGDRRPWMFSHSLPRSTRTFVSARSGAIPFEREKELSLLIAHVTGKMLRRDADHDMRDAIQRERLSDDVRVGTHLVLPVAVSKNHDGFSGQRVITGRVESGASSQRHAERLEVVRRDEHRRHRLRAPSCWRLTRDLALSACPADQRHPGIGLAQGLEIRIGPPLAGFVRAMRRRDQLDETPPCSRRQAACAVSRAQYGIAMIGTMPIPSDTTHTNVNARAFASDRPA